MKEIKIVEVKLKDLPANEQFSYQFGKEQGEHVSYFIAYETAPNVPNSVLFPNMKWLRKHFGITQFDESSPITVDSLNEGRRNEIELDELCLKFNCPMWELNEYNRKSGKWKMLPEKEGKPRERYQPGRYPLSDEARKMFQGRIDKGLYVICKIKDS